MEIKRTRNYDMFSLKKENREVNYNKVNRLKSKLLEDGRQIMPIICNKQMEIMDGQHRFEALKELNWEIMYYIDEAVTSLDLISINNTQKNWGLNDYIHYHAALGNETYIKIERLLKEYDGIPLRVILVAIAKTTVKEHSIKDGLLKYDDIEFKKAEGAIRFVKDLMMNIKFKVTSPGIFYFLVIKAYYLNGIDRDKLFNSIVTRYGTENYGNSEQCAIAIEHWYNHRMRGNYRYISNEILPRR